MRKLELQDPEMTMRVDRETDENPAILNLLIDADDVKIVIHAGNYADDASNLKSTLQACIETLDKMLSDWQDNPDYDGDGFVFASDGYGRNGGYTIKLNGVYYDVAFPSKDIATYALAAKMTETGYFPAVWYEGPGSYGTFEIESQVRAFHDEGGTDLLPLEGVDYEAGDELVFDAGPRAGSGAEVVRDYGTLGIHVLIGDGEPWLIEHKNRDKVSKYVAEDD